MHRMSQDRFLGRLRAQGEAIVFGVYFGVVLTKQIDSGGSGDVFD